MLALEHAQEREPHGSLGMLYVITNTLHRNPCDDKIFSLEGLVCQVLSPILCKIIYLKSVAYQIWHSLLSHFFLFSNIIYSCQNYCLPRSIAINVLIVQLSIANQNP